MSRGSYALLVALLTAPGWLSAQQPITTMTYEEAISRLQGHSVPEYWPSRVQGLSARLDTLARGSARVIAITPGGRPVHLVTYGELDSVPRRANFNSAIGARDARYYMDRSARRKPVVLFVGPVHGQEVEGLVGLVNLIHVMETGRDLLGRDRSELRSLGERCRLLIIPTGNPDGVARFEPGHLNGLALADLEFWGQGTWADGTLLGWPGAKQRHPMVGEDVGHLGSYFNDAGVNPMHDEFFHPMSGEASAILDAARLEGPDLAVSLHSHGSAPTLVRTAYVPVEVQEAVRELHRAYNAELAARGLPTQALVEVKAEAGNPPAPFNLSSALYHVSGAVSFLHENSHGLVGYAELSLEQLLEVELALYEVMLRYALSMHGSG